MPLRKTSKRVQRKKSRGRNRNHRMIGGNSGITWSDYILLMPTYFDGITDHELQRIQCSKEIFLSLPHDQRNGIVNFNYINKVCPP
jgi:hypothetical protein